MKIDKLMIIKGYVVTEDGLINFMKYIGDKYNNRTLVNIDNTKIKINLQKDLERGCYADYVEKHTDIYKCIHLTNKLLLDHFCKTQIYYPSCCSEVRHKKYFIGICVKAYDRLYVKCNNNCTNFAYCDDCIGQTENGSYNVHEIFDNITEINPENICKWCNNDNKEYGKCKFCDNDNFTEKKFKLVRKKEVDTDIREFHKDKIYGYFYFLNYCPSCQ